MRRWHSLHVLIGLTGVCLLIARPAMGQSGSAGDGGEASDAANDPVQQQLQQMQKQLESLRNENQAMKGEIDELRAATNEDWLTEARADEIRGLVTEVLADADTRASLLQDGIMAGWSDHFFLADPSGKFKLVFEGQMQIRWIYNYTERTSLTGDTSDQHRQGFENSRTRLTFRGHVFSPDIQYLVRGEFARTTPTGAVASLAGVDQLLDAWVRYNLNDEWNVRFGQFKLPFNREELVSSAEQLAVERSLVNEALNLGRSQGIELGYHDDVNRLSVATSDGASGSPNLLGALLGGQRTNTSALLADVEYDVTARYENLVSGTWDQFSDFTSPQSEENGFMWGIAAHAQESESDGIGFAQESIRNVGATADLSFEWGGANAFFSAIYQYVDVPPNSTGPGIWQMIGLVGQAGVYITPKWELFVRGDYAQVENYSTFAPLEIPDLCVIAVGANYYLEGHDLKWTSDLSVAITEVSALYASELAGFRPSPTSEGEVVFRTQFQLLF